MTASDDEDYHLLGLSLAAAQRVEFLLYGLAAHAARTPAGQKEKRFRNLTPESFLRGPSDDLKATLGQLVEVFGDTFLIKTSDLVEYYQKRNFIAHDYYTHYHLKSPKQASVSIDGKQFLRDFLSDSFRWESILRGLLSEFMRAAAVNEGRDAEVVLSEADLERIEAFRRQAASYLASKSATQASS